MYIPFDSTEAIASYAAAGGSRKGTDGDRKDRSTTPKRLVDLT